MAAGCHSGCPWPSHGSGAVTLFAWGLWGLINILGDTALVRGRVGAAPWLNLLSLVQLLAGLIIGLIILFLLAERDAAQPETSVC